MEAGRAELGVGEAALVLVAELRVCSQRRGRWGVTGEITQGRGSHCQEVEWTKGQMKLEPCWSGAGLGPCHSKVNGSCQWLCGSLWLALRAIHVLGGCSRGWPRQPLPHYLRELSSGKSYKHNLTICPCLPLTSLQREVPHSRHAHSRQLLNEWLCGICKLSRMQKPQEYQIGTSINGVFPDYVPFHLH